MASPEILPEQKTMQCTLNICCKCTGMRIINATNLFKQSKHAPELKLSNFKKLQTAKSFSLPHSLPDHTYGTAQFKLD